MSSIRKSTRSGRLAMCAGLAMAAATMSTGCSHSKPPQAEPLNSTPLVVDGAMQRRDWSKSVAYYQNGSVKAYATRYNYVPSAHRPEWAGPIVEPVIFIGETFIAPIGLVRTRPFTSMDYNGVQFEPTYSAMPPLPPSVGEQGGEPGQTSQGPAGTVAPGNEPAPAAPTAPPATPAK